MIAVPGGMNAGAPGRGAAASLDNSRFSARAKPFEAQAFVAETCR
jgi:hypothetical protein